MFVKYIQLNNGGSLAVRLQSVRDWENVAESFSCQQWNWKVKFSLPSTWSCVGGAQL